jgi:hypothetical protein
MDRKVVVLGVVASLWLAAAGCGASSPLTRAQFVRKADAICARRSTLLAAAARKHPGDLVAIVKAVLPQMADAQRSLEALRPPHELERTFRELMVAERQQLGEAKQAAAGHMHTSGGVGEPLHRREALRRALGIDGCN